MIIGDIDNDLKRQLRVLASNALDAELEQPLRQLAEAFHQWKTKSITSLDLDRRIYDFEIGPRKQLAELYDSTTPDVLVARAIAHNILRSDQISETISDLLRSLVTQFKEGSITF